MRYMKCGKAFKGRTVWLFLMPLTFEIFLFLLQVWTGFYPFGFKALSFLVFVLFRLLLFMLAIRELLVSANGGVGVWGLGAGSSRRWLSPLQFGNNRRPTELVRRVQTVWAPLEMIVGFVEVHFDLCRVSVTGGAPGPVGAVVSMRGRLQRQALVKQSLFFGGLTAGWVRGKWALLERKKKHYTVSDWPPCFG